MWRWKINRETDRTSSQVELLQEGYEKYPLGKLILMVIPSQQEGFGNNETYLLDNLLSPLFTALPENQDRPGTNGLMIIMENMQF